MRIDRCAGHAVEIPSSTADRTHCVGLLAQRIGGTVIASPAYDTTNTYDGLSIQDPSGHMFVGCTFHGALHNGTTPLMRYGINDSSSNSNNRFYSCNVNNPVTADLNVPATATVVGVAGMFNQLEETVTGPYTPVIRDLGKVKRYTGAATSWTMVNIGVGTIVVENAGSGALSFSDAGSTRLTGTATTTLAVGSAARIQFVNGGANYRVSAL